MNMAVDTREWYQKKSNIIVIIASAVNTVAAVTGYIVPPAVNEVMLMLWALFIRQGISNGGN